MVYIDLWLLLLVWLFLISFLPINCFKLAFLQKAIMGCKLLNIYLKMPLMFNIYQYLFIISFTFFCTGLHINNNSIVSLGLGLEYFKSNDLSRWSTCFLKTEQKKKRLVSVFECF